MILCLVILSIISGAIPFLILKKNADEAMAQAVFARMETADLNRDIEEIRSALNAHRNTGVLDLDIRECPPVNAKSGS